MRAIFLFVSACGITLPLLSQTLFDDARLMRGNLDKDSVLISVLSNAVYIPAGSTDLTVAYEENVFLKTIVETVKKNTERSINDLVQEIQASVKDKLSQIYNNATITASVNAILQSKNEAKKADTQISVLAPLLKGYSVEIRNADDILTALQDTVGMRKRIEDDSLFLRQNQTLADSISRVIQERQDSIESSRFVETTEVFKRRAALLTAAEKIQDDLKSEEEKRKKALEGLEKAKNTLSIELTKGKLETFANSINTYYNIVALNAQFDMSGGQSAVQSEQTVVVIQNSVKDLQSSLIDATASFIADRFQEEIAAELLKSLREFLNTSSGERLRYFFPNTSTLLKSIQSIEYSNIIQALRASVQMDINSFYFRLPELIKRSDNTLSKGSNRSIYATVFLMLELSNGTHPHEILSRLANSTFVNDSILNTVFRKMTIFSQALLRKGNTGELTWLTASEFKQMEQDPKLASVFVGLVYQRLIKFGLHKAVTPERLWSNLSALYTTLHPIDVRLTKLSSNAFNGHNISANDLLGYGYQTMMLLEEIAKIDTVFNKAPMGVPDLVKNTYQAILAKNYSTVFYNSYALLKIVDTTVVIHEDLVRYSSLLISLANAQNNEDIKNAINAAALPAGSYNIKRQSQYNFAINNYTGFAGGYERLISDRELSDPDAPNIGFTSPVGFAFSWGNKQYCDSSFSSFTLLISVFDLGAVVNFRLQNKADKLPEDLTFGDLISPGLHFLWGVNNRPYVLGLSFAYSPALRSVREDVNGQTVKITGLQSLRVNLIAAIDIPLFNIFTTPR